MKTLKNSLLIFLISLSTVSMAQGNSQKSEGLENNLDTVSYALGMNMAFSLQQAGVDSIDLDKLRAGIEDVLKQSTKLSNQESLQIVQDYIQRRKMENALAAKKHGHEYMVANRHTQGTVETASGLQYRILEEGHGPKPSINSMVKTHYKGKLLNGKVFDSSYKRGYPSEFKVNQVIPGWTEALQMMPVGSKWELVIPSELAYGERETGSIPAHSVLIFEVELLDIIPEQPTVEPMEKAAE